MVGALLLGLTVLCLLYPVVRVESGARLPLLLLVGVPVFAYAFARWERRLARLRVPPLLDLALLRGLPGYVNGLLVGALYFTGYTGLVLVVSVYLQEGLDYSPLRAGLLLMPFAVGSAVAAPLAGRFVSDVGRRLTVAALLVMMSGVALLAAAPGHEPLWLWAGVPLLVAGLGGGAVISPNITLTLMRGAAADGRSRGWRPPDRAADRASIGAAVLMTVYQVAVESTSADAAVRLALATGLVLLSAALAMAVRALRQQNAA